MSIKSLFFALTLIFSNHALATAEFECTFDDGLYLAGWASREAGTAPHITYIGRVKDGKIQGPGHQIPQTQVKNYVEKDGKVVSFEFTALGMDFKFNEGTITRQGRSSKGQCGF